MGQNRARSGQVWGGVEAALQERPSNLRKASELPTNDCEPGSPLGAWSLTHGLLLGAEAPKRLILPPSTLHAFPPDPTRRMYPTPCLRKPQHDSLESRPCEPHSKCVERCIRRAREALRTNTLKMLARPLCRMGRRSETTIEPLKQVTRGSICSHTSACRPPIPETSDHRLANLGKRGTNDDKLRPTSDHELGQYLAKVGRFGRPAFGKCPGRTLRTFLELFHDSVRRSARFATPAAPQLRVGIRSKYIDVCFLPPGRPPTQLRQRIFDAPSARSKRASDFPFQPRPQQPANDGTNPTLDVSTIGVVFLWRSLLGGGHACPSCFMPQACVLPMHAESGSPRYGPPRTCFGGSCALSARPKHAP